MESLDSGSSCWEILGLEKILMPVKGLDDCEMRAINLYPWSGSDQYEQMSSIGGTVRNYRQFQGSRYGCFSVCIWRCLISLSLGGH